MSGEVEAEAGSLTFHVLGPLQIIRGETRLTLGGPRQRALLGALLIQANTVVSTDRLIEEIWDGHPPPGAMTTLQSHVSHLRRVLEPERARRQSGAILVTDARGYLLRAPAPSVDSEVFAQLVQRGRSALDERDCVEATAVLTAALGMWRGAAYADLLGYRFAHAEGQRLEELRTAATELKIEGALATGHHHQVICELIDLTRSSPLHEAFHAQLILALYRCGRQADALSVYDRIRRTLADDLGVDPSPRLRELHGRVLAQDRSLEWEPPSHVPVAELVPDATEDTRVDDRAAVHDSPVLDARRDEETRPPAHATARRRPRTKSILLITAACAASLVALAARSPHSHSLTETAMSRNHSATRTSGKTEQSVTDTVHDPVDGLGSRIVPPPAGFFISASDGNGPLTATDFDTKITRNRAAARLHYVTGYRMTYDSRHPDYFIIIDLFQFASPHWAKQFEVDWLPYDVNQPHQAKLDPEIPGALDYNVHLSKTNVKYGVFGCKGSLCFEVHYVNYSERPSQVEIEMLARIQYGEL